MNGLLKAIPVRAWLLVLPQLTSRCVMRSQQWLPACAQGCNC
jgi:hypothetical protein